MIAEPPLLEGKANATETVASAAVAVPIVGAPGNVAGVTLFDTPEEGPSPRSFLASTVHVTAVPFVRPVTVIGDEPVLLFVPHVALYSVIAEPPSLAGGVKDTVTVVFPLVAVPIVGAPGTVAAGELEKQYKRHPGERAHLS